MKYEVAQCRGRRTGGGFARITGARHEALQTIMLTKNQPYPATDTVAIKVGKTIIKLRGTNNNFVHPMTMAARSGSWRWTL